jgi:hypothetical protein
MIEKLLAANDGKHKWIAYFTNGRKVKFGAKGYSDYTIHKDKERRERYRERHEKDLTTQDPYKPGYLSYYLLWGDSPSLDTNVKKYNQKFF